MQLIMQVCAAAALAGFLPVHVTGALVASTGAHHHHHHHHPHGGSVRGSAPSAPVSTEEKPVQLHAAASPPVVPAAKVQEHTAAPSAEHKEIQQEVEQMDKKIDELHDVKDAMEFAGKLTQIEVALKMEGEGAVGMQLMNRVTTVRANLCVKHHLMSSELKDCENFMHRACHKGKNDAPQVDAAQCHKFFLSVKKLKHDAESSAPAPNPAPYGAASPAASPITVDSRGLTPQQIAEARRIWTTHGKREGPLPEQGFSGEMVDHKYMHTMSEDWQTEFGPAAGHKSFIEVCADHPDNEWCRLHGYYKKDTVEPAPWYGEYGELEMKGHGTRNEGAVLLIGLAAALVAAAI